MLAQLHIKVGVTPEVLAHNTYEIRKAFEHATLENCDLVLCPELAISGYSPEDLLLRHDVQEIIDRTTDELCAELLLSPETAPAIIFGSARRVQAFERDGEYVFPQALQSMNTLDLHGVALGNAAVIVDPKSQTVHEVYKAHLPNWGVFDEARIFARAGHLADPIDINGVKVGIAICRDIWIEDTVFDLVNRGAEIILVPNASPFANARHEERIKVVSAYAQTYGIPIAYVNMISGCDEVVFEGGSFACDSDGEVVIRAMRFEKDRVVCDLAIPQETAPESTTSKLSVDLSGSLRHDEFYAEESYKAIVLGVREFINSVSDDARVGIGISGGIDSALVATIAVDALGADRVEGVLMPSRFTSEQSNNDAFELAKRLGINARTISIENLHETAYIEFGLENAPSLVSENIQARLRGMVMMMLSNSEGLLPLATSNKSESAVGYCTLYGDTVGAFAPIKDVYKTQVYDLCQWRNKTDDFVVSAPIPEEIIVREPTAELREFQTDEESLLPYEILDVILQHYIDYDLSAEEIINDGFVEEDVRRIIALVNENEFKRKQTPIGLRLTRRNFGKGRRVPISAKI
jgi:NAD+ synthase (glutamine-hydrolysing)